MKLGLEGRRAVVLGASKGLGAASRCGNINNSKNLDERSTG